MQLTEYRKAKLRDDKVVRFGLIFFAAAILLSGFFN